MKKPIFFVLIFCIWSINSLLAQSPQVEKVEPPNWWAGMKWNEVQLMVYGEALSHITARSDQEQLKVKAVHTLPNSSYAFIDLELAPNIKPGTYRIEFSDGQNKTTIEYPILEREDPAGRYQGFNKNDLVYLITPDRFADGDPANNRVASLMDEYDRSVDGKRHGGDLQGLINHLDYMEDLGITCIWLNPVLENSGRGSYHGYAATDLYNIDARFGDNELYQKFVREAHNRGIKVIFDHVNNHIGINHEWMKNLPMESWVNGTKDDHLQRKHYKHSIFDPYADEQAQELLRDFWFVSSMPDLNQRNPFMANYLIQNSIWWIEYTGLDGIREDTYPYPDQRFLADWAKAIVGEIWNAEPASCAIFQTHSFLRKNLDFDTHLPAVMDFPLCNALSDYLSGKVNLMDVYAVFTQDILYADTDNLMTSIDNHDMARAIFIAEGGDS